MIHSPLRIVHLSGEPIIRQLQMEEALLRVGTGHWCLFNHGAPAAIVMGLAGSMSDVVCPTPIPVIRRFSGGGTVVVDEDTVFFSLILDGKAIPCQNNPVDVMAWVGALLAPAFAPHSMKVEGQDFAIDGRKIGGNAQSFSRSRIVHHTSFLWSWTIEKMALLPIPYRQPVYRNRRSHEDFCHRLSEFFPTKALLVDALVQSLDACFLCQRGSVDDIAAVERKDHRKTVQYLPQQYIC